MVTTSSPLQGCRLRSPERGPYSSPGLQVTIPWYQPRPQGLLLVQNGSRRTPWAGLPKWLQKFVRISSRKHGDMSSFCLNNGFRLQKANRAARLWKQPQKKSFHHVSRDKILHDSRSISTALARGFSNRHFFLNEEKALGTRLPWYRSLLLPRAAGHNSLKVVLSQGSQSPLLSKGHNPLGEVLSP